MEVVGGVSRMETRGVTGGRVISRYGGGRYRTTMVHRKAGWDSLGWTGGRLVVIWCGHCGDGGFGVNIMVMGFGWCTWDKALLEDGIGGLLTGKDHWGCGPVGILEE